MVVHGRYPVGEPRVEQEARAAREAGFAVDVIALQGGGEPRYELVEGVQVPADCPCATVVRVCLERSLSMGRLPCLR